VIIKTLIYCNRVCKTPRFVSTTAAIAHSAYIYAKASMVQWIPFKQASLRTKKLNVQYT